MSQNVLDFAIENALQMLAAQHGMKMFDVWYEFLHDQWIDENNIEYTKEITSRWTVETCEMMLNSEMPPVFA